MDYPLVLVVMPLYNAYPYLKGAIESILMQTYPHFKLLIINDGSTDGSELEAAKYQNRGVILWQQENQGPGVAMNRAIQYALDHQFPYLARIDADDISSPLRLEKQIRLLENYPTSAACSSNCNYIDAETGKNIGSSTVSILPNQIRWEIFQGLRGLIQGACVFRTEALAAIGGYRSQFKHAEEVDLFLRLAEKNELRNCGEYLYNIRLYANSSSIKNIHQNVLYQFYALDCSRNRRSGSSECDFESFLQTMSPVTKYKIWREEYLLNLWRSHIHGGHLQSLLLATLLDPRRVWVRMLRKLHKHNHE